MNDDTKWLGPEDLQHSFEVEPLVHECVRDFGGEVIADLLPKSPGFPNADYLFRADRVIAELKCLQSDFAAPPAIQEKVARLYRDWFKEGSVTSAMIWQPDELPKAKRRKLKALYTKPLQRVIEKANRQLRETAAHFEMDDARKLLLIANDGLYSLESLPIVWYLADVLRRGTYSNIDGFVYFMVNSYVEIPGDEYARQLWIPLYDERAPDDLPDFVNRFGRAWGDFFGQKVGGWDDRYETDSPDPMLGARHIPPSSNPEAI